MIPWQLLSSIIDQNESCSKDMAKKEARPSDARSEAWEWIKTLLLAVFTALIIRMFIGTSLVVQWFGTSAVPVRGPGSLPGRGATIPQCAAWPKKKI